MVKKMTLTQVKIQKKNLILTWTQVKNLDWSLNFSRMTQVMPVQPKALIQSIDILNKKLNKCNLKLKKKLNEYIKQNKILPSVMLD
jgi:ribosome-associated translation inhibitor RaiA